MNRDLVLKMAEAIRSIKDENGEPRIKHIDLWNRQVEFLDQELPFPRPAVFFEFGETVWEPLSSRAGLSYRGKCPVALHIVTDWSGLLGINEEQLKGLELSDLLAEALEGLRGESFDSFHRYSSVPNHDHDEIIETIERYSVKVSKG